MLHIQFLRVSGLEMSDCSVRAGREVMTVTPQIEREERSRGVSWSTGMLDAITLKL